MRNRTQLRNSILHRVLTISAAAALCALAPLAGASPYELGCFSQFRPTRPIV